jgi:hypothetical protein
MRFAAKAQVSIRAPSLFLCAVLAIEASDRQQEAIDQPSRITDAQRLRRRTFHGRHAKAQSSDLALL